MASELTDLGDVHRAVGMRQRSLDEMDDKATAERWYQQGEIVQEFLVRLTEPYLAKPTVLDQTIEGHLRARYWLDSMLRLRSMFDFQAIMAGARARRWRSRWM